MGRRRRGLAGLGALHGAWPWWAVLTIAVGLLLRSITDTSIACVDERVACDGIPPKICSRCRDMTRQCRYRHLEMEAASVSPTSPPRVPLPVPGGGVQYSPPGELMYASPLVSTVGLAALGDATEVVARHQVSSAGVADVSGDTPLFGGAMWPTELPPDDAPAPWLTELILSATMNQSTGVFGVPESAFDWGLPELALNMFTTPADVQPDDQREDDLRVAVFPEEVDGRPNHPQPIPDGQPSESVWVSLPVSA